MIRHIAAPLLALLFVSACATPPDDSAGAPSERKSGGGLAQLFSGKSDSSDAQALRKTELAGGDVVLVGPAGYCIAPESIGLGRNFAVLASCQVLTDGKSGLDVPLAVMTVTVDRRSANALTPDANSLARASGSTLVSAKTQGDLVLARLATGGAEVLDGGEPSYWRGAFPLGTRQIGLALYLPKGSRLRGDAGAALLAELYDAIVAASPQAAPPDVAKQPQPLPGFGFGRLLNRNRDGA